MVKKIEFGINESLKEERLNSGWDKIDSINGIGQYLGIIRIGNRNLMITLNTDYSNFEKRYSVGNIKVNEIEYDTYQDGNIIVYYNIDKGHECAVLEDKFNSDTVKKMLENGASIYDILNLSNYKINPIFEKRILNEFKETTDYVYPNDYDYKELLNNGLNYEKNNRILERKVETLIVTGISNALFMSLKESKNNHMSMYQMIKKLEKLKLELNESKDLKGSKYGK